MKLKSQVWAIGVVALMVACASADPQDDPAPRMSELLDAGRARAPRGGGAPAEGDGGAVLEVPEPTPARGVQTPIDHVSGARYTGVLVELDIVPSAAPTAAALEAVQEELSSLIGAGYLGKPDGFRFVVDQELPALGAETVSTIEDLDALAQATQTLAPERSETYIHLLYVDGHFEEDGPDAAVLGLAYSAANVVMFRDNVRRACAAPALSALPGGDAVVREACAMAEASVLMHELGHAFGLVNNGIPMVVDHQDVGNGAHDVNPDCLMYYAAESSLLVEMMAGRYRVGVRGIPKFDEPCLADLAAVARRAP